MAEPAHEVVKAQSWTKKGIKRNAETLVTKERSPKRSKTEQPKFTENEELVMSVIRQNRAMTNALDFTILELRSGVPGPLITAQRDGRQEKGTGDQQGLSVQVSSLKVGDHIKEARAYSKVIKGWEIRALAEKADRRDFVEMSGTLAGRHIVSENDIRFYVAGLANAIILQDKAEIANYSEAMSAFADLVEKNDAFDGAMSLLERHKDDPDQIKKICSYLSHELANNLPNLFAGSDEVNEKIKSTRDYADELEHISAENLRWPKKIPSKFTKEQVISVCQDYYQKALEPKIAPLKGWREKYHLSEYLSTSLFQRLLTRWEEGGYPSELPGELSEKQLKEYLVSLAPEEGKFPLSTRKEEQKRAFSSNLAELNPPPAKKSKPEKASKSEKAASPTPAKSDEDAGYSSSESEGEGEDDSFKLS